MTAAILLLLVLLAAPASSNTEAIAEATTFIRSPSVRHAISQLHHLRIPGFRAPIHFDRDEKFLGISNRAREEISDKVILQDAYSVEDAFAAMDSPFNEQRLFAIDLLRHRFSRAGITLVLKASTDEEKAAARTLRKELVHEVVRRIPTHLNNWNLVDNAIPSLLGHYLVKATDERPILYKLARSKLSMERRAALVGTLPLVSNLHDTSDLRQIAALLVADQDYNVRRALSWLLQEASRFDPNFLVEFLNTHGNKVSTGVRERATSELTPEFRRQIQVPNKHTH